MSNTCTPSPSAFSTIADSRSHVLNGSGLRIAISIDVNCRSMYREHRLQLQPTGFLSTTNRGHQPRTRRHQPKLLACFH